MEHPPLAGSSPTRRVCVAKVNENKCSVENLEFGANYSPIAQLVERVRLWRINREVVGGTSAFGGFEPYSESLCGQGERKQVQR